MRISIMKAKMQKDGGLLICAILYHQYLKRSGRSWETNKQGSFRKDKLVVGNKKQSFNQLIKRC